MQNANIQGVYRRWRILSATRRFLTVRVVKGHRLVLVAPSMLKLGAA